MLDYLNRAAAWLAARTGAAVVVTALVLLLLRLVPTARWVALESRYPRAANVLRVLRAALPDVYKTAKAMWFVLTGKPWPLPEPAEIRVQAEAQLREIPTPIPPASGGEP